MATYMMYLTFSAINAQQTINVLDYNTTENTNTTVGAECTERCFSVPQSFALWAIGISNDNINVIDLIGNDFKQIIRHPKVIRQGLAMDHNFLSIQISQINIFSINLSI